MWPDDMMRSAREAVTRIELAILYAILAAAFLLRLASVIVLSSPLESDMLAYDTMARTLLSGSGMRDHDANRAFFSMGYPFFVLAPVYWLTDGSIFAAKLANCVLGTFSVFLCWLLLRVAGQGALVRLLAAGLYAIYLPTLVYATYLFKEHLLIPLILMLLCLSLHISKQQRFGIREACAAGLLCGLIALVGNAGLSCSLPLLIVIMRARNDMKARLAGVVLTVLLAILVCIPWVARNQAVLGHAVLNTNVGFNLYIGNNPAASGDFVSIAETPRGQSWHELRSQGEWCASETLRQEAHAWIRDNPVAFVELAFHKAGILWRLPVHAGKQQASTFEVMVRQAWLLQYVGLMVLALYALAAARRNHTIVTATLCLALIGYTSTHMLFYASTRYREAVMPLVCMLAALGLGMLVRRIPCVRRWGLS